MIRPPIPKPDRSAPWWPQIERALTAALQGCPEPTRDMFTALFAAYPPITSGSALASHCQMPAAAFTSRFQRAGLPSPGWLVDEARLVRLAFVLDDATVSGAEAASLLRYSSPQTLHRHLLNRCGAGTSEWRGQMTGAERLERFVTFIITKHCAAWQTTVLVGPRRFVPLAVPA